MSLLLNYNGSIDSNKNKNRLEFKDLINHNVNNHNNLKDKNNHNLNDIYNKYTNVNKKKTILNDRDNFNKDSFNDRDTFKKNIYNQNLVISNRETFDTNNSTINSLNNEISDLKKKNKNDL